MSAHGAFVLSKLAPLIGGSVDGKTSPRKIVAWRATLPAKSAEKYPSALRQVLNYAVRVELLDRNPARDVPKVKVVREEIAPFESWLDIVDLARELPTIF